MPSANSIHSGRTSGRPQPSDSARACPAAAEHGQAAENEHDATHACPPRVATPTPKRSRFGLLVVNANDDDRDLRARGKLVGKRAEECTKEPAFAVVSDHDEARVPFLGESEEGVDGRVRDEYRFVLHLGFDSAALGLQGRLDAELAQRLLMRPELLTPPAPGRQIGVGDDELVAELAGELDRGLEGSVGSIRPVVAET